MTAPSRVRDLGGVQELIRLLEVPPEYTDELVPYVREKYTELWKSVQ